MERLFFAAYAGIFTSLFINKIEKLITYRLWGDNKYTIRPLYEEGYHKSPILDIPDKLGMPSGFCETAALMLVLMFDRSLSFLTITAIASHRLVSDRNSEYQVIVGSVSGMLQGGFYHLLGTELAWFAPPIVTLAWYAVLRQVYFYL